MIKELFKRKMTKSLIVAGILMLMAGCGAKNMASDSAPEASVNSGNSSNAANLLEKIKQIGKVTVGTEAAYEPFEYIQDGKIVGYGSDILAYIVKQLGVSVEQKELPFQGILPGLEAKQFDFVATSVSITPERAEKYGMSVPIADGTVAVLKRKGDDSIKKPEDIAGKVVGTQLGSGQLKALKAYDETLKKDKGKGTKEIKEYVAYPEAYQDLANGRVDAVVNTMANLSSIMKKQPDAFEMIDTFGEKMWISWVARKEDRELLAFINEKILEMKKSGKLAELQKKWFGYTMETPEKESEYLPQ
jgi:polar amino acid transport system substrate-binding protein